MILIFFDIFYFFNLFLLLLQCFIKGFSLKLNLFYEMGIFYGCNNYFSSKTSAICELNILSLSLLTILVLGIAIFILTLFLIIIIGKALSKTVTWTGVGLYR